MAVHDSVTIETPPGLGSVGTAMDPTSSLSSLGHIISLGRFLSRAIQSSKAWASCLACIIFPSYMRPRPPCNMVSFIVANKLSKKTFSGEFSNGTAKDP